MILNVKDLIRELRALPEVLKEAPVYVSEEEGSYSRVPLVKVGGGSCAFVELQGAEVYDGRR